MISKSQVKRIAIQKGVRIITSNKELAELDMEVAKIEGYTISKGLYISVDNKCKYKVSTGNAPCEFDETILNYSTNKERAMELLIKYKIEIKYCMYKPDCACSGWIATLNETNINGETPMIAICRAIVERK